MLRPGWMPASCWSCCAGRSTEPELEQVTEGWPLAMDIMTFRHDALARLTHRLAASPDLLGAFSVDSDEPAIDLHSVHHLLKMVDRAPVTRPP